MWDFEEKICYPSVFVRKLKSFSRFFAKNSTDKTSHPKNCWKTSQEPGACGSGWIFSGWFMQLPASSDMARMADLQVEDCYQLNINRWFSIFHILSTLSKWKKWWFQYLSIQFTWKKSCLIMSTSHKKGPITRPLVGPDYHSIYNDPLRAHLVYPTMSHVPTVSSNRRSPALFMAVPSGRYPTF